MRGMSSTQEALGSSHVNWMRWCKLMILALEGYRQRHQKLKAILGYIGAINFRPACSI